MSVWMGCARTVNEEQPPTRYGFWTVRNGIAKHWFRMPLPFWTVYARIVISTLQQYGNSSTSLELLIS
jgi:hypothetical protein